MSGLNTTCPISRIETRAAAAASLTVDRYEFIRNLQGELRRTDNGPLPPDSVKQLPPLDDSNKGPLGK